MKGRPSLFWALCACVALLSSAAPAAAASRRMPSANTGGTLFLRGVGVVPRPRPGEYIRFNRSAAVTPQVAVSDYRDGIIFIYAQYTHVLTGEYGYVYNSQMPLRSDGAGNLYVLAGDHVDVLVLAPNSGVVRLSDPRQHVEDLAVDSDGTTYLVDGRAEILVYAKGQSHPSRFISDATLQAARSIAVAANHDVYVLYADAMNNGVVGRLPGGKGPIVDLRLAGSGTFTQIKVARGYVIAMDSASLGAVEVFAPHATQPSHVYPLGALGAPIDFDYAYDLKSFFVADGTGRADQFAYPSGALLGNVLCGENGFCGGVTTLPNPPM